MVALLAGEAHLIGVSFSVSRAAPALNAGHTKSPAEVFLTDFSAEFEGCFSWDFIHCEPACWGHLNLARARHFRAFDILYRLSLLVWLRVVQILPWESGSRWWFVRFPGGQTIAAKLPPLSHWGLHR